MPNENPGKFTISERLQIIKSSRDPVRVLANTIETKDEWFDAEGFEAIAQERYSSSIASGVNMLVRSMLTKLIADSDSEDGFYDGLWKLLSNDTLFANDLERESAFAFVVTDQRLPYFNVETIQMDDETFHTKVVLLEEAIRKLRCLSQRSFAQKTEHGSAILDLILQYESPEDRAVLMGIYLTFISMRAQEV